MSYNPTQWSAGDTVTSAKLNKMEQGIKNNIFVTNIIVENGITHLDKTWQEIYDANFCIANMITDGTITTSFVGVRSPKSEGNNSSDYAIVLFFPGSTEQRVFFAATPDDYPHTISNENTPPMNAS